jgi:F-type H+-transporting ATPase subunit b
MIKLDWTILIQMINFIILIWALNYVAYRPIRGVLARRKEKIEGLQSGIARFESDSRERASSLDAGLREAREKGIKMKEALEEKARQEEKQMIERITEKAVQDLDEIKTRVARETMEVRTSLQSQIEFFANEISRKILGRTI